MGCGRAAIVAAHPDDETLGAGGILPRLREPIFIHVTDGAPRDMRDAAANGFGSREEYGQARRREFLEAMRAGGVRPAETVSLGYADQEASLHMAELTRDLLRLLRHTRPRLVLVHPYEGGHPDHDAAAFAVHAAWGLLPPALRPRIVEYTSYHNCGGAIETGTFLPAPVPEIRMPLGGAARERKERMLACFKTQQPVLQYFGTGGERFRAAPAYDFTAPPHSGRLFYEQFSWGMKEGEWTAQAEAARRALGWPYLRLAPGPAAPEEHSLVRGGAAAMRHGVSGRC